MRSPDPAAAARSFVTAGTYPRDAAAAAREPMVKICGVTDEAGILAAVRAGADAIGLNSRPARRARSRSRRASRLAALARSAGASDAPRPQIVLITVELPAEELAAVVAAVDPDAVQLCGDEPPSAIAAVGRPAWKALRVLAPVIAGRTSSPGRAATWTPVPPGSCSMPRAARTRAARASAWTRASRPPSRARCRSCWPAASAPRTSRRPCSWYRPPARTWRPARTIRASPASGHARTPSGSPSAAGPTPSGSSPGSSASRRSAWRLPRPRATAWRRGATRRRSWAARPGSSTGPGRSCSRIATAR